MKTIFRRLGLVLWVTILPSLASGGLTTLTSLTNKSEGAQPCAGLAPGSDGNFYGTCFGGGSNGFGSIFKITPSGALSPLHSFTFIDGETPTAGLVQGSDGNFYGTTFEGGTSFYYGTVFQVSSNGAFTSLYSFTNGIDGANPYAGLAPGSDGAFYGTTVNGGSNNNGAVYQITSTGTLTPLYSFTNGVDGSQPRAALTFASDGSFYGTTYVGGTAGEGVVFHITTAGALTPLYSFTGAGDGGNPAGQLTLTTNGVLYGTAYAGGAYGGGTVFTITTGGAFNVLYAFTGGNDGAYPAAGLAPGSDGNFYGTTFGGGPNGDGGIFKITSSGSVTPLYLFTGGNDGATSFAMLAPGKDGDFYGTTQYGGAAGEGVVFKINPYATAPVLTSITRSAGTIGITWSGLPGQTYQAQFAVSLTQTRWNNLGGHVTAANGVGSQTDSAPGPTQRFYRVYLVP